MEIDKTSNRNIMIYESIKKPMYNKNLLKRIKLVGIKVIIYKDDKIIYDGIINSNLIGDKNIHDQTKFPPLSMPKPITTVTTMILFEDGKFMLDDPIEKYLPEFENLQFLDENGIAYPCNNSVTVFDLLA